MVQGSPAYDELWQSYLLQQKDKAKEQSQGPQLKSVQTALLANQASGGSKYSSDNPDKEDWGAIGHHARCLYRLDLLNKQQRGSALRGMALSDSERFTRLWLGVKRVTHDRAPSRSHRKRPSKANNRPQKFPRLEPFQQTSEADADVVSALPAQLTSSQTFQVPVGIQQGDDDDQSEESTIHESTGRNTNVRNSEGLSEYDLMKVSRDMNDPLSLSTAFGKYTTTFAAVRLFKDITAVKSSKYPRFPNNELNAETRNWHEELASISGDGVRLEVKQPNCRAHRWFCD